MKTSINIIVNVNIQLMFLTFCKVNVVPYQHKKHCVIGMPLDTSFDLAYLIIMLVGRLRSTMVVSC